MARFEDLLEKFRRDDMADAELGEFLTLLEADASPVAAPILEDLRNNAHAGLTDPAQRVRMLARILEANRRGHKTRIIRILSRAAAAAVLITMITGSWFWFHHPSPSSAIQANPNDIAPGGNKAVLILANGSTIILDSAHNGALTQQGNATIVKTESGQLSYHAGSKKTTDVVYNTLATPRGGQYKLVLPDGSKVWLNAASSIRFPVAFGGESRDVDMTGEAYFEIVHRAAQPFRVHALGQVIEDIGTKFNVNAYTDEPVMATTLEEGSVRTEGILLAIPADQAVYEPSTGKALLIQGVDLERTLAWKEGMFEFENADLETVLRTLGRWYDFDVVYNAPKDTLHLFTGYLSKLVSLNVNFRILGETGYHLRVEGRKIIVLR